MREGMTEESNKAEEIRKQREQEEVIDEEEAPQVVIDKRWKGRIDEKQAREYVAEKEGVKMDKSKDDKPPEKEGTETKVFPPAKPRAENVSLGMKAKKKGAIKRSAEEDKEEKVKSRKMEGRKEKKLKLSFEEDE
jgi:hypothetical protein